MFLLKRSRLLVGFGTLIAWSAVLTGCSVGENDERVRAYVDSLIARDLDTAVTLVCARSTLQGDDIRISLENFAADEGKVTGVAFGRGSPDEATLFLEVEMNGSRANVTYLLPVEKEKGVWMACPDPSHPFGRPAS